MHDIDVRCQLHAHLRERFSDDPSTVFVDELGIREGRARVDVAAVNGHLYGYEIKAAADKLCRLERQVGVYSEVLDFAAIVVADKHLRAARAAVPRWWGVYVAQGKPDAISLRQTRRMRPNPHVNPRALAELLWHQDTMAMLEERHAARGVRGKARSYAWDRLCEVCSLDEIRDAVRVRLKARSGPRVVTRRA